MSDARRKLLEQIRERLADLPAGAVHRAMEYYEEYIAEAEEAGRSDEEILRRFGGIDEIVRDVRAEVSFERAETSPGPVRLAKAGGQALRGLAGSAARSSLFVGGAIPYLVAMLFYLCGAASLLGAVGVAALAVYGILVPPLTYLRQIIGVAGAGLLASAALVIVGLGIWSIGNAMTRLALRAFRRGRRRAAPATSGSGTARPRRHGMRTAVIVFSIAGLLGIAALFSSGLPVTLFTIWNSARPSPLETRRWTYDSKDVRQIDVTTMSSSVSIVTAPEPRSGIQVTYEEPAWLAGSAGVDARRLRFRETSRGMLPFMDFLARHVGMTSLTITVPEGYRAELLAVTSIGGSVTLDIPAQTIQARTATGVIRFTPKAPSRIRATAPTGRITVRGTAQSASVYIGGSSDGSAVDLNTSEGAIEIR
jgi:uncharacterized membrane protein